METRKKIKIMGAQDYINSSTGEIETMQIISIEERDANFHKIWLKHIIQNIEIIGNQKTKFAFWILDEMNSDNIIIMTMRQMSKKSGISVDTVSKTIKALIENNFLIRQNISAYRVNPEVIFKGGKTDRLNVLFEYTKQEEEHKEKINKSTNENILKTIKSPKTLKPYRQYQQYQ